MKILILCKECDGEPGADAACLSDRGDDNGQARCARTPDAASPSGSAADCTEADPLSEQARCVRTHDTSSPSGTAANVTEADYLPEAIAPSLATTPEFARRNTSWCHAIEVRFILCTIFPERPILLYIILIVSISFGYNNLVVIVVIHAFEKFLLSKVIILVR